MNLTYIDKLAFVQIENKKLMMSWETGKTAWMLPGGKREGNETDQEALARELEEELSVKLIKESVKLVGVYEGQAHGKPEGTTVRITCYSGKYTKEVKPNPPVERVGWVNSSEENISITGKMLLKDLKSKDIID